MIRERRSIHYTAQHSRRPSLCSGISESTTSTALNRIHAQMRCCPIRRLQSRAMLWDLGTHSSPLVQRTPGIVVRDPSTSIQSPTQRISQYLHFGPPELRQILHEFPTVAVLSPNPSSRGVRRESSLPNDRMIALIEDLLSRSIHGKTILVNMM